MLESTAGRDDFDFLTPNPRAVWCRDIPGCRSRVQDMRWGGRRSCHLRLREDFAWPEASGVRSISVPWGTFSAVVVFIAFDEARLGPN